MKNVWPTLSLILPWVAAAQIEAANPVPAAGFSAGVSRLLEAGFSERELDPMIRRNPAQILTLDP